MKKFKHKKTNQIAVSTHSESNYKVSFPRNFTIPKWIIEESDDWEEIKEVKKEWEILSFKDKSGSIMKGETVTYVYENKPNEVKLKFNGIYLQEQMLEKVNVDIHSVKRLSDGEVFTINDKLIHNNVEYFIKEFTLSKVNDGIYANLENSTGYLSKITYSGLPLNNWVKIKEESEAFEQEFSTKQLMIINQMIDNKLKEYL